MSMYRIETRGRRTFPMIRVRGDIHWRPVTTGVRTIPGVRPLVRVDRPKRRGEFFPGGALKARPADPSARFFITRPAHEALKAHRLAREIRASR